MKPPKPRVQVEPDSTFAKVEWTPVRSASYYTVRYSLFESPETINELSVTSTSVLVTSLVPGARYTVYVKAVVVTQCSQETVVHFSTTISELQTSLGSGSTLFPGGVSDPNPYTDRTFHLKQDTNGYRFNTDAPAVFIDSHWFQFCTFDAGTTDHQRHIDLQLSGASGPWMTATDKSTYFDKTIVQVKVEGATGWMDANRLRVPGVLDAADGARVFDGLLGGEWHSFRVTFSSIQCSCSGRVLVRIGITDDERAICGVNLL